MRTDATSRIAALRPDADQRRVVGKLLAGIAGHTCSVVGDGGPVGAEATKVSWPHLTAHLAVEIQRSVGATMAMDDPGRVEDVEAWDVTFEYEDEDLGVDAGRLALALVRRVLEDGGAAVADWYEPEFARLRARARWWGYRGGTLDLVGPARERGIPVTRLDTRLRPLLQLGHGVHQRRIRTSTPDTSSVVAASAASDKVLTLDLLSAIGISVSHSITVGDPEAAVGAAERIGYPVVVKPRWGARGENVFGNLREPQDVREAFNAAHIDHQWNDVLVQRHERGREFRIAVMDGEVVAVLEKVVAHVTGDGRHAIEELVASLNADPMRGTANDSALSPVVLDAPTVRCLATQGLQRDSIPAAGRRVVLSDTTNTASGASTIDRTDEIHPDNVVFARTAARAVGLDVVAVDLIADDISVPFGESHAVVHEVNSGFGFAVHALPSTGTPRRLYERYLERLIPLGSDGRIPIIALVSADFGATYVRLIAHVLIAAGRSVGTATADGLAIDGVVVSRADARGPDGAHAVLRHPLADVAVLELTPASMLADGLGFDRADVAIIHDGVGGAAAQLLARNVAGDGTLILEADDPDWSDLAGLCPGAVVLASDGSVADARSADALGTGEISTIRSMPDGAVAFTRGDQGAEPIPVARLDDIAKLVAADPASSVGGVLSALAAAISVGATPDDVRRGLLTFTRNQEATEDRRP